LTLGGNTDQALTLLGETDDRRSGSGTLTVLNDSGSGALHDGDGRVGGTEIDTDDLALDLLITAIGVSSSERRDDGGSEDRRAD
jgi:hypothetical protein